MEQSQQRSEIPLKLLLKTLSRLCVARSLIHGTLSGLRLVGLGHLAAYLGGTWDTESRFVHEKCLWLVLPGPSRPVTSSEFYA